MDTARIIGTGMPADLMGDRRRRSWWWIWVVGASFVSGIGCGGPTNTGTSQAVNGSKADETAKTTPGTKEEARPGPTVDDPKAVELLARLVQETPVAIYAKDANGSVRSASLGMTKITDADLALLKGLPKLKRLGLGSTKVTDKGLVHIKEMKQLEGLLLSNDAITDAGLEHLKDMVNLKELDLFSLYGFESRITDAGMKHLKNLKNLEVLVLTGTGVGDASIEVFKGMAQLNDLRLSSTRVTKKGLAQLQKALRKCDIQY
jgi:hypothetical protein